MSQRRADDWWQKLYEDQGAGGEPDPDDTLDHRYHSAVVLVKDGEDPAAAADPPGPLLPGQRREAEPAPPAEEPPPDPRRPGPTGYALGEVTVPPVPPDPPAAGLPLRRRRSAPPADTAAEPAPAGPAAPEEPPGPLAAAAGHDPAGRPGVRHLGDRAPTYAAEPGALPEADPAGLGDITPDTVLEGARYGTYALRAASLRGDSARFRGEARRDFLLTARFGSGDDALVLVALAGGDRAAPGAREAAAELCHSVAAAVGRSRQRLAEDIRAGSREALRSGLQRLTDRGYGRLRAHAAELGLEEEGYTAGLRGLLLPVDPQCRTRVCFGAGAGGFFRLRAGQWQDLEPEDTAHPPVDAAGGFRFRASVARPGDTLLLCSGGLAAPMREEGLLPAELAARWSQAEPPGLAAFLADVQLRLKGYADDRTAAAVWEA
ncbi:protein phosphatase 2C domain-containing protein [Streptomyces sp. NBC_00539]|uniref:protein phosphatase 2C domain-containing protein n=1 Tax=Streptomyces sp. NBC_00539 TaxID=2975770 RepID=UPI002E814567|nr:protein phosphatase 2C domain-containing protein [Streptomyces sp. NBC_00539]WUC64061.1 protein phosphatase 2C domain-containing protein [Streptomyces sp. NBC_00539]